MDYSSFTNASWKKFRTLWKKWFPKVKKTFMGSLDEWNALTPAEQAEYDLLITPEEADGGSDIYSTTETKTNKVWINGKPIYRRVFYSATNWPSTTIIGNIPDLDMMIEIRDIVIFTDANNFVQNYGINEKTSPASISFAFVNSSTGDVRVERSGVFVNNKPSTVIVEYTKTTD